jgi:hypothetical protein
MAYFMVLFKYLPLETEESYENLIIASLWAGYQTWNLPDMKQECTVTFGDSLSKIIEFRMYLE